MIVVCAIIKDEPDLLEWLAYHRLLGVDHFYLYDNGSQPPIATPWEFVTVYAWPHGTQNDAYDDFLFNKKVPCEWVAFIDGDEYVVLKRHASLRQFLCEYDASVDSVGLAWLLFDSNGHRERPPPSSLVIESYTRRLRESDGTMKRILRPEKVRSIPGAHMRAHCVSVDYSVQDRLKDVNALGAPVRGIHTDDADATTQIACIHHYYTRSLEDWHRRLKRGQARPRSRCTEAAFWTLERAENKVEDYTLARSPFPSKVRAFISSSSSSSAAAVSAAAASIAAP